MKDMHRREKELHSSHPRHNDHGMCVSKAAAPANVHQKQVDTKMAYHSNIASQGSSIHGRVDWSSK